jgi:gliding motility-associated-like protein
VVNLENQYSATTSASPLQTTTYYVLGVDANGCIGKDSTIVYVTKIHELYVPSAFSPNGDGINDLFKFYTKGIKQIRSIAIYNRWGEQIFYTEGEKPYWDGTYKGKQLPSDVFVYVITAETYDDTTVIKKGNITLLR